MNAPSISTTEFSMPDNSAGDSDSDTSDEIHDFYQPISSSYDAEEEETLDAADSNPNINGYHTIPPNGSLSNGHGYHQAAAAENGIRNLDLSQDRETERHREEVEEEQEEEARRRAEAIRIALEEDESRRNAPLSSENANRVMEAMRGVSFSGLPPDWASHLSEDHLLDRLRSIRPPPPPSAA